MTDAIEILSKLTPVAAIPHFTIKNAYTIEDLSGNDLLNFGDVPEQEKLIALAAAHAINMHARLVASLGDFIEFLDGEGLNSDEERALLAEAKKPIETGDTT